MEGERAAVHAHEAATGGFFQFAHAFAHNAGIFVGIGQLKGEPLGEKAVEFAGNGVEPLNGDQEVNAVGFALAGQRHERPQQIIIVVARLIAKGLDVFAKVVHDQQNAGCTWRRTVVVGGRVVFGSLAAPVSLSAACAGPQCR
ncbi:MAG: hypothetical protein R2911_35690 [Caldilineaceae bacterium]